MDHHTDGALRAEWAALAAVGLPSPARRGGDSQRPHVTLAARRLLDAACEPALAEAVGALPLPVRVGAIACFGRGSYVLVRLVVASRALLDLQAAVTGVLGPDPATDRHFAPGRWTPHVTLARRLTAAQVGAAVAVLAAGRDLEGRAVACRRWDGDARREWRLVPDEGEPLR
jgi:2'-5' RNA ligase